MPNRELVWRTDAPFAYSCNTAVALRVYIRGSNGEDEAGSGTRSSEVGDGDVPEGVGAATGLKMINRE